jgi:hypothetical protein
MRQRQKDWVHAVQERVNFTSVILKEMRQIKMFEVESDVAFVNWNYIDPSPTTGR